MGLNDAIVEKDFWVCFTLDYLFHRCPWKNSITFKGGTSLSKAFNLISRFSEDIDLILDWRILGYEKQEPWEKRSNTKQDAFNKEANNRAKIFLAEQFCPSIRKELSLELGRDTNIYIDEKDKQTVIFAYPNLFTNPSTLQVIRLESGHWRHGLQRQSQILNHTQPSTIQKFLSRKILQSLLFHQSVHFGKRQQFFTMKQTGRSILICPSDIPDITMIFIEWLRLL